MLFKGESFAISIGVAIGVTLISSSLLGLFALYLKKRRKIFVKVGTISRLIIYPVKSAKGIEVAEGEAVKLGLKYKELNDRYVWNFWCRSGVENVVMSLLTFLN